MGRGSLNAEYIKAEVEKLLPSARELSSFPDAEYGADRPAGYWSLEDKDARWKIVTKLWDDLKASSPIKRGDIVWIETSRGPRQALILTVNVEHHEGTYDFILTWRYVMKRADGSWGTQARWTYPGFIERGFRKHIEEVLATTEYQCVECGARVGNEPPVADHLHDGAGARFERVPRLTTSAR